MNRMHQRSFSDHGFRYFPLRGGGEHTINFCRKKKRDHPSFGKGEQTTAWDVGCGMMLPLETTEGVVVCSLDDDDAPTETTEGVSLVMLACLV